VLVGGVSRDYYIGGVWYVVEHMRTCLYVYTIHGLRGGRDAFN
jgi:hypothetical protein